MPATRKTKPAVSGSRTNTPTRPQDVQPSLPRLKAVRRKDIATPMFELPPQRFELAGEIMAPDPGPGLFDTSPDK